MKIGQNFLFIKQNYTFQNKEYSNISDCYRNPLRLNENKNCKSLPKNHEYIQNSNFKVIYKNNNKLSIYSDKK